MPQEIREVLLKYGKNPTFYSESREDAGFFAVTGGSAAQSSIIDDFAALPFLYAKGIDAGSPVW